MQKIGILTFHSACNYGAFLQAMSLQNYITSQSGVDCSVINYCPYYIEEEYSVNPLRQKSRKAKLLLLHILRSKDICKRNRLFRKFRESYLHLSEKCSDLKGFTDIANNYDTVIVGSDQVWNYDITKGDPVYFFGYTADRIKKYSYAASIGGCEYTESEEKLISKYLEHFRSISVREEKTRDKIRRITGRENISVNLDPVFLTRREEWLRFASAPKERDYILFFMMGVSEKAEAAMHFAEELGRKTGYQVLFLSDQERWYKYRKLRHVGVASPAEFLGYIANAKWVVTNSFHAAACSVILQTPFFVETEIARNDRILNLLAAFGLEKYGLVKGKLQSAWETVQEVDWNKVGNVLEKERDKAVNYLQNILDH